MIKLKKLIWNWPNRMFFLSYKTPSNLMGGQKSCFIKRPSGLREFDQPNTMGSAFQRLGKNCKSYVPPLSDARYKTNFGIFSKPFSIFFYIFFYFISINYRHKNQIKLIIFFTY